MMGGGGCGSCHGADGRGGTIRMMTGAGIEAPDITYGRRAGWPKAMSVITVAKEVFKREPAPVTAAFYLLSRTSRGEPTFRGANSDVRASRDKVGLLTFHGALAPGRLTLPHVWAASGGI